MNNYVITEIDSAQKKLSAYVTLLSYRYMNLCVKAELGALMLSSVLRSPVAIETSIKITRAFVAMRQMLTYSTLPEKVVNLAQELYKLKEEVNDILADQNDINESTRAQLDAISTALAELQAKPADAKPRRRIGFIQEEDG